MDDLKDWIGAGLVTSSKLFIMVDEKPVDVTADKNYGDILLYLPGGSDDDDEGEVPLYLVGRAVIKSKNGNETDGQASDVVKLFANATWDAKLLGVFERVEFVLPEGETDLEHLESDSVMSFTAGDWSAEGKMELFWHLPGPGKPTAKVTFVNGDKSVSAFWCWPE